MHILISKYISLKILSIGPDNYPIKPYTVISSSMLNDQDNEVGNKVCLMVKSYSDGHFTSKLRKLKIGSKMSISNFTGSFDQDKLLSCKHLVLLCAGSGFTPMIRILTKAVYIDSIKYS